MLKKILNPKNFSAVMWLFAALGAVTAMFFKHASVRDDRQASVRNEKGRKVNIYKLGEHAAFVTNKTPKSAAADSVKSFFSKNI